MTETLNTVIAIRSFDLHSDAFSRLSNATNIIFINTSGQHLSEEELCSAIKDADGIIAGTEHYSKKVLAAASHLKVISRVGVGLDNIDQDYAGKNGIRIVNTPVAPVEAVAEHTVGLIFSVCKNIPQYYDRLRREQYAVRPGLMVLDKTIGLVGMGKIGQKVALLLSCLGARIVFFDPFLKTPEFPKWKRAHTLPELLAESDIISLHSSPQAGNVPLFDDKTFALCKKGCILINTARGSLVDETALARALDSGIVSSAGLDVVSVEPYRGVLLSYPQVVLTPHVASNTVESRRQMEIEAVHNMLHTFGI